MMRVSILGPYTLDAFSAAIPRLTRDLAANEIQLLTNISLYLTPWDKSGVRILRSLDGQPIKHIKWSGLNKPGLEKSGWREASVFPASSSLDGVQSARANWKGGDLSYLRSKWDLSVEELAALLGVAPGRVLSAMASVVSTLSPEESLRIAVLLQIDAYLAEILHPQSVRHWLRSGSVMEAFEGGSPLEQLTTFGIAAMDRMHRALSRYLDCDLEWPEALPLRDGFDWIVDFPRSNEGSAR